MEAFYTVNETTTRELTAEKSRFIGIAVPVTSQKQTSEAMAEIRERYPDARHYVYAYRLYDGRIEKSSDDGEPQGTGGRPVLDLLQHRNVWNVLLVVVRYFGGVLLGTGGLTRAYGGAARLVITGAELKKLTLYAVWRLDVPYEWFEPLKHRINLREWKIIEEEFLETVRFKVLIPCQEAVLFTDWVADSTGKKAWCEYVHDVWA